MRKEADNPGRDSEDRRRLQFIFADILAGRAKRLQPCGGDSGISSSGLHNDIPSWVCSGSAPSLLWPAGDCLQVQALGVHGGSFPRVPSNGRAGGVLWDRNLSCG
ncbi:unnamed protein product [Linum tenue]|uniref:Uncharacterized protein n=1 Tax=Linum tenue TaxID=586396 RepID=A0AAV0RX89_9ROSI|nr:unnamed protein product [Linum tenue]